MLSMALLTRGPCSRAIGAKTCASAFPLSWLTLGRPPDPSGAARISDEIKPNPARCLASETGVAWGVALSNEFCAPDPVHADVPATNVFAGVIFGFFGVTEKSGPTLSPADSSLDGCKFCAADNEDFPA